ncbi:MAG TPA: hypothetical protein PKZ76_15620 [Xanthomonadaceae bacterium]|nr:hypothetical protein [Xanthomonadaceae bacterium]
MLMHIRRRRACFVQVRDEPRPDLPALLRGAVEMRTKPAAELLCPLGGGRIALHATELGILGALPGDRWLTLAEALTMSGATEPELLTMVEKTARRPRSPSHPGGRRDAPACTRLA